MATSTALHEPNASATEASVSSAQELPTLAQVRWVQADASITKHVALAVGTGFIPFPIFDIVATTGVQTDLLFQLFKIYGYHVSKEKARSIATVLIGASLPTLAARFVASGLKLVPVVGTGLGFFTSPSLAGASTYAVGKVVQEHLAGGGNPLDIHLDRAKAKVKGEIDKVKAGTTKLYTNSKDEVAKIYNEGKDRLENAAAALKGKKSVTPAVEEHVEATS
jgi:uncharacterized protein (DUF697 family)